MWKNFKIFFERWGTSFEKWGARCGGGQRLAARATGLREVLAILCL